MLQDLVKLKKKNSVIPNRGFNGYFIKLNFFGQAEVLTEIFYLVLLLVKHISMVLSNIKLCIHKITKNK